MFNTVPIIPSEKLVIHDRISKVALKAVGPNRDRIVKKANETMGAEFEIPIITYTPNIKSFDSKDLLGLRPIKYVRNLQKISAMIGVKAETLELDLQKFEELMSVFVNCKEFLAEQE